MLSKFSLPSDYLIDPRAKPILISNNIICFKQKQMLVTFNYKTMQIIKTINFNNNNYPFQLYKEKNKNYFYIILFFYEKILKKIKIYFEVIKYNFHIFIIFYYFKINFYIF